MQVVVIVDSVARVYAPIANKDFKPIIDASTSVRPSFQARNEKGFPKTDGMHGNFFKTFIEINLNQLKASLTSLETATTFANDLRKTAPFPLYIPGGLNNADFLIFGEPELVLREARRRVFLSVLSEYIDPQ